MVIGQMVIGQTVIADKWSQRTNGHRTNSHRTNGHKGQMVTGIWTNGHREGQNPGRATVLVGAIFSLVPSSNAIFSSPPK